MAKKRAPYRPTPPTPIVSARTLRKRIKAIEATRAAEQSARRANLALAAAARKRIGGNAFVVCHELLEETTQAEWSKERERPVAYWDESWLFEVTDGAVAYEELQEWHYSFIHNRTIAEYFDGRVLSILIDIADGRQKMTLTAAAASSYDAAMGEIYSKLEQWAESYGRGRAEEEGDEESFSHIEALTLLIRRDAIHPKWRKVVRGRVEEREGRSKPPAGKKLKPPAHSKKSRAAKKRKR